MNINERIERLQTYHLAKRLCRKAWHKGALLSDGYEHASLLATFSPEAAEAEEASACPADAMPAWLANLTPYLDDRVSDEAWPQVIARYVAVIPKLVRLPAERLVRLDFETRACAVREARSHATEPKVLEAIDGVLVLLDRAALGKEVTIEEWSAARETAAEAAWAAAAAEETEAWAEAWAAWGTVAEAWAAAWAMEGTPSAAAAAATAAWAVAWATDGTPSAAWAAAEASANASAKASAWAAAEEAEETAAEAAREAALRAAWDRMADAMLSAWELAV